jgi:protein transport protein SEC24
VATEVFASADPLAILTLIAKKTVQRPSPLALEDKREQLFQTIADMCAAYKAERPLTGSSSELLLPDNLKMLPVLILGLFKKVRRTFLRIISLTQG